MSEMLSPDVYLRCSENSTEKPWNGLACRPEMKPSTMNLARQVEPGDLADHLGLQIFFGGPGHEMPPVPTNRSSDSSPVDSTGFCLAGIGA